MINNASEQIGKRVRKKSGKPFKSGLKSNTVKSVRQHPFRDVLAFTFDEDDSCVAVDMCKPDRLVPPGERNREATCST